ncbi:hypothetical protein J503_0526 [Acinetobacter baumannii 984213]|nr:hypothetical protein [Acinetobacter baumannii]EXA70273.1 hypothetical protein J503_0526 [Acinetobacter baumannii 984213]
MDVDLELKAFIEAMKKNGCPMWMFERDEDGNFEDMTMAHSWYAWQEKAKAQAVPDTHMLVEKKNIEDWYLDEDEGLWLDHDGIDGSLCELTIGEVKPVQHKEYLITQSQTLYAARVWDDNDDHIAWKLFDSEAIALEAAKQCKSMYDASKSGAEQ